MLIVLQTHWVCQHNDATIDNENPVSCWTWLAKHQYSLSSLAVYGFGIGYSNDLEFMHATVVARNH